MLRGARVRAMKRGLEFAITLEDVKAAWPPSGLCPVLDVQLTPPGRQEDWRTSVSLDRIDSTKGYTPDNIAVISTRANMIKNDGTAEEHEKIAKWMRAQAKPKGQ